MVNLKKTVQHVMLDRPGSGFGPESGPVKIQQVITNHISNIGKTTTQNQCERVPDLWRPGSVIIKRYYARNGRLIPTAKRGKEIKQQ